MRICSYVTTDGQTSFGVVEDGRIFDAGSSLRARYRDVRSVLAADALGELAKEAKASPALNLADVSLLPPIPQPDKIICIGLNYMTHIKETGRERPAKPSIFTRYPSSLVGNDIPLIRPKVSDWFDFEGELAVVIGKRGRAISAADAGGHIAGYTCFNDGSVRDFQRHTSQFWAGKNFDRSGSMGPWLVTADEMGAPEAQHMTTRLNGEVVQSTPISDLAFDIPALIEYLSTVTELLPGDVIATGTPSGVGLFREPKLFMKPGDRIEVEITGIGTLSNMIEAEV
jgi:2-keto-4-pentenoate hydratase/2-oxohepta-3-ene-1,7-dioic acid hydratase in catechol pathway